MNAKMLAKNLAILLSIFALNSNLAAGSSLNVLRGEWANGANSNLARNSNLNENYANANASQNRPNANANLNPNQNRPNSNLTATKTKTQNKIQSQKKSATTKPAVTQKPAPSSTSLCGGREFSMTLTPSVNALELFEQISLECGFALILDAPAADKLRSPLFSMKLSRVKLGEILEIFAKQNDLFVEFGKKFVKISATKTQTFKLDYINSVREGITITKASVDNAPVQTNENYNTIQPAQSENSITTTERLDFWASLREELAALLSPAARVVINQAAGLITITAAPHELARARNYIATLQTRLKKQVLIDVTIVSVELEKSRTRGIDWSEFDISLSSIFNNMTSAFSFGRTSGSLANALGGGSFGISGGVGLNINGVLNFLATHGDARVVSSPKIMTLNNQQALISVGDTINYRVSEETTQDTSSTSKTSLTYNQYSIFVGILLNLLPSIGENERIMLRVTPSLSQLKYTSDMVRQNQIREIAPDTVQKKLSTVVDVKSGESVVLGGLITQSSHDGENKVFLLGELPVVGWLFKSKSRSERVSELVFIITPYIVEDGKIVQKPTPLGDVAYPVFE